MAAQGSVCLVALDGFADPQTLAKADHVLPLGHFGAMIAAGKNVGAKQVTFIGGLDRPSADQIDFDAYSLEHLDRSALLKGDDAALRAIAHLFERAGLRLIGPIDLAPHMVMPVGRTFGTVIEGAVCDGRRGLEVALALGALDVGQAVVVQQGLVLAVEGIEGTDALIQRAGALARPGRGPVLVKAAKPQQDMRLDMPTFGLQTLLSMADAGFAGAFLEVGRTLVISQEAMHARAIHLGLFVAGIRA